MCVTVPCEVIILILCLVFPSNYCYSYRVYILLCESAFGQLTPFLCWLNHYCRNTDKLRELTCESLERAAVSQRLRLWPSDQKVVSLNPCATKLLLFVPWARSSSLICSVWSYIALAKSLCCMKNGRENTKKGWKHPDYCVFSKLQCDCDWMCVYRCVCMHIFVFSMKNISGIAIAISTVLADWNVNAV